MPVNRSQSAHGRVLVVMGTRPEALKLVPVVRALRENPIETLVCATGQHREMLEQVTELFGIEPDFDLNLMEADQDPAGLSCGVLRGLGEVVRGCRPDWVVVQGDTTTTFASALAAFHERVPVAHVEAGLRTGNLEAPWPEELNRRLTTQVAAFHFPPTERARRQLLAEGVAAERIRLTGNTAVDVLLLAKHRLECDEELRRGLERRFSFLEPANRLVLVTGHRRESFGAGLERICRALRLISRREGVQIVYPVHPNPCVREPVFRMLGDCGSVRLIEPQDYLAFVYLMSRTYLIITDSGGIQEEAPSLGKPVLVTREATERPEAIEAGAARLVGTDADELLEWTERLLEDGELYRSMAAAENPFGDGRAAQRIAETLTALVRSGDPPPGATE